MVKVSRRIKVINRLQAEEVVKVDSYKNFILTLEDIYSACIVSNYVNTPVYFIYSNFLDLTP